MSISVLLLSVLFALIEAGLSYLCLAFEPISSILAGCPSFLIFGGIVAIGMLLSFLLIILIGFMNVHCQAADFVRDYFGKTIALALISTLVLGALATGAEALYQIRPSDASASREGYTRVEDSSAVLDTLFTPRHTASYVPVSSEIEQNVQNAGGNTDAPLRFSIQWNEPTFATADNNDVDAHCQSDNEHIFFSNKIGRFTGGTLDVDIINPTVRGRIAAVENIVFPDADRLPGRTFQFYIECYSYRNGTSGFRAEIEMGDQIFSYDYPETLSYKQQVPVADVTVDAAGNMSIVHHLNCVNVETVAAAEEVATAEADVSRPAFAVNSAVVRCVLLGILAFLFKLICSVCIGKNNRNFLVHVVISLLIAVAAALVVEFGYSFGLPVWAILCAFWLLLTTQFVSAK